MIRKFLDLSTGHLTEKTREWISSFEFPNRSNPLIGAETAFGWFLYVQAERGEGVPDDLWSVMRFAQRLGCEYLYFDADAEVVDGLIYYEETQNG